MLDNISLGRYFPGQSVIHRLDPRTKIISAIIAMIVIFMVRDVAPMIMVGASTIILVILAKVPLRTVLSGLKPMVFILLFAFVLNLLTIRTGNKLLELGPLVISDEGLFTALRMAARLTFLILDTTLLLTLTTTPILVSDALENLLGPLKKVHFPAHEMAMMMSIALRFVPTLLEETDKIMKAQSSRGADYDTGGLVSKARGLVSVLIPLFVSAFKRAEDLAVAMEARCYRGGEGRTRLKVLQYSRLDLLFSFGLIVMGAITVILEYVL